MKKRHTHTLLLIQFTYTRIAPIENFEPVMIILVFLYTHLMIFVRLNFLLFFSRFSLFLKYLQNTTFYFSIWILF